jgi:ferric-dicitrate binding protein FerR (iron transport regulator)
MTPRTHLFTAPRGSSISFVLNDGTAVDLASGSVLTETWGRFSRERQVALDGEAFFDVVPSEKPFVVETFNARIRVLGTAFNVRAWEEDLEHETVVTLQRGRLAVDAVDRPSGIVLQPGEMTVVRSDRTDPLVAETRSVDRIAAWRRGGIAFMNRSLDSVLKELERRYDVTIRLREADLAPEPILYLQPNPGPVQEVLADICFSKGLQFIPVQHGYEVLRADSTQQAE